MGWLQVLECSREARIPCVPCVPCLPEVSKCVPYAPPQEPLAHEIGICANSQTVSEIKTMFPALSEYQIAQALHANDHDKGAAISSLRTAMPTTVSRSPHVIIIMIIIIIDRQTPLAGRLACLATCQVIMIIIINMLMLIQQSSFTHLRVLLVLTNRGIIIKTNVIMIINNNVSPSASRMARN
jgi:hypothetical protein